MAIRVTTDDVIEQLKATSAALSSLSYSLSALSGTFNNETEPRYSYVIYQVVESATGLHNRINELIIKMSQK